MPIRFRCSACSSPLSIATRKALTGIACPRCKGEIVVPAESDPYLDSVHAARKSSAALPVAPEMKPASAPSPDLDGDLPVALPVDGPTAPAAPMPEKTNPDVPAPAPAPEAITPTPLPAPVSMPEKTIPAPAAALTMPRLPVARVAAAGVLCVAALAVASVGIYLSWPQKKKDIDLPPGPFVWVDDPPSLPPQTPPAPPTPIDDRDRIIGNGGDPKPEGKKPEDKKPEEVKPPERPPVVDQPAPKPRPELAMTKRRDKLDAEDLRKQLLAAAEVSLDAAHTGAPGNPANPKIPPRVGGTGTAAGGGPVSQQLVKASQTLQDKGLNYPGPVLLRDSRADLAGLPMRMGQDCHLGKEPAEDLQVLSRKLRVHIEASIPKDAAGPRGVALDTRPDPERLRELLLSDRRNDWLRPAAVPALMQLLQAENSPLRKLLIELLGEIKGKEASAALAMRALTDLSPELRELASRKLADRPAEEYRKVLLDGFRYPWGPVADHAAETLVMLDAKDSVPDLVRVLTEPDVGMPRNYNVGGKTVTAVPEVVRINHLANCVLCHAPSHTRNDFVRGAVPTPGEALPAPATTPQYYERGGTFVRADVTYLRQDFSVMQNVDHPNNWPTFQRYDYLVRLRPLTPAQAEQVARQHKQRKIAEQKEAALYALRELTGKDLGTKAEDWFALAGIDPKKLGKQPTPELVAKEPVDLPREPDLFALANAAEPESPATDAKALGEELVKADGKRQEELLGKLRDGQSAAFTDALAAAIPSLKEPSQSDAREALVERLKKLSATELTDKLSSGRAEVRRAAVVAIQQKGDRSMVPFVIPMIEDRGNGITRAAREALVALTGEDFGPAEDAPAAERERAVRRWTAWWKAQSGLSTP